MFYPFIRFATIQASTKGFSGSFPNKEIRGFAPTLPFILLSHSQRFQVDASLRLLLTLCDIAPDMDDKITISTHVGPLMTQIRDTDTVRNSGNACNRSANTIPFANTFLAFLCAL
jgi:hypothetical protein